MDPHVFPQKLGGGMQKGTDKETSEGRTDSGQPGCARPAQDPVEDGFRLIGLVVGRSNAGAAVLAGQEPEGRVAFAAGSLFKILAERDRGVGGKAWDAPFVRDPLDKAGIGGGLLASGLVVDMKGSDGDANLGGERRQGVQEADGIAASGDGHGDGGSGREELVLGVCREDPIGQSRHECFFMSRCDLRTG
jgi:hypothetical protein